MDIKQIVTDTAKSAKFNGVAFSGGLDLAPNGTLDLTVNAQLKANVDLPGDSEKTVIAVFNMFGLGKSPVVLGSSPQ